MPASLPFSSSERLVLDLHGLYNLCVVGGVAFDVDLVTDRNRALGCLHDRDSNLAEGVCDHADSDFWHGARYG